MPHEKLWIGILFATLIIFVLISAVLFMILSTRRERLGQFLKEANYKAKISEISFSALRSQMNPHFIFNCLNSIKYFIEQNDRRAASDYLDKFASLIRSTLDNARCEKIILQEEINSLKTYVDLEAMRFKDKLSWSITLDENVDADFIEIPPMIIQPYVENAIWHGLMQRESGGRLSVHVSQRDDTTVFISINDNGVGRAKAAQLKAAGSGQKSHGTAITSERIAMLNEKNTDSVAAVQIKDEYDENNLPAGTTVVITLPLK